MTSDPRAATELLLIRHGESTGNSAGRMQGQDDTELSPHGREQAALLAQRLAGLHDRPTLVYSSDLRRAHDTAQAVAAALGTVVHLDPRLRELDVGTWAGMAREEIATMDPVDWRAWEERRGEVRYGGAESFADLQRRVVPAVAEIADRHPGAHLVVVTHGVAIRTYLAHVLGLDLSAMWQLAIANTALCRVHPHVVGVPGAVPRMGRVDVINDATHLERPTSGAAGLA